MIFIGTGNLATRLSLGMKRVGFNIVQVYSYTQDHATSLAEKLGCEWTTALEEVHDDAELYVFSLKDSVLPDVIAGMKPNQGIWIHTAGVCRWMCLQVFQIDMECFILCKHLVNNVLLIFL